MHRNTLRILSISVLLLASFTGLLAPAMQTAHAATPLELYDELMRRLGLPEPYSPEEMQQFRQHEVYGVTRLVTGDPAPIKNNQVIQASWARAGQEMSNTGNPLYGLQFHSQYLLLSESPGLKPKQNWVGVRL